MRSDDAFRHFGGKNKTARALGLTSGGVSLWGEHVPEHHAKTIHEMTGGAVPYDAALYAELRRIRSEVQRERTTRAWREGRMRKPDHATAAKRKERTRHE